MTLPDPNFLAAPLWLITALHVLTLTLHFAAMNFVVGGLVLILFGKFERRWENGTVRQLVKLLPSGMAATVTLGVAPLLFVQLVYPAQVYSAAIVSAWFWLLVIPVAIGAYSLFYGASFKAAPFGLRSWYLWPALGTLLYISLVYSAVFSMAERPDLIQRLYGQAQNGWRWNPEAGDYILRWLHMVSGAVAVGGFFVGLLGRDDPEAFPLGKKALTFGMIASSAIGIAFIGSLGSYLPLYMKTSGIWAVTAGFVLAAGALHFFYMRRFLFSGVMLFASLLCMVFSRHELRLIRLGGQFDPASWRVAPQWSFFFVFLVAFLIAVAVVVVMLRMFFQTQPRIQGPSAAGQNE